MVYVKTTINFIFLIYHLEVDSRERVLSLGEEDKLILYIIPVIKNK